MRSESERRGFYVRAQIKKIEKEAMHMDCERAHSMQEDLYIWVLKRIRSGLTQPECKELATLALKSEEIGFSRWFA